MIVSLHAPRKEDTYAADAAAVKKSFKAGKSLSTTCYNCQLVVWIMSSGTFFHGAKNKCIHTYNPNSYHLEYAYKVLIIRANIRIGL